LADEASQRDHNEPTERPSSVERPDVNRTLSTAAIIVVSFGMVGAAKSAGNVAAGKSRSVVCAGCHGVQGEGLPPTPRLAGIPQDQLIKALKDFKSGTRANAVMKGLAASLSDKDMEDVSAYYATLTSSPAFMPTLTTTPASASSAAPAPTTAAAPSSPQGAGVDTAKSVGGLGDKDRIAHSPPVAWQNIHARVVDPSLRKPSPPDARVSFVGLQEDAVLPPKATIHFGLSNMGVAPAGIEKPNTGHHHLLIDTKLPDLNKPIPSDFNHLHFGAGQTEAEITLTPGYHTLQLLLGDQDHVPHNPPVMSKPIRVLVTRTGR
jgi:cytochrome c553